MIEAILPRQVSVAEAREDDPAVALFPEEEELIARAVEKRRREFTTGRDCARRALACLGLGPAPIPSGNRGEPRWPPGVVGSITHCDGYRAAAVARSSDLAAIGIDAEPHAPLPAGLLEDVVTTAELGDLDDLTRSHPEIHWDRLFFSAKEAVFKAWYPLAERPLDFLGSRIVFDPIEGSFEAHLPGDGPHLYIGRLDSLKGRWALEDGLLVTAVAVAPPDPI
jgi:4'-phosphopantetheinyl transferase EntD